MTYGTVLAELYRRLGYAATPAAAVTTRLAAFLNTSHRQILSTPGLDRLRDDTVTFASVVDRTQYGLPQSIQRIQAITDRTNDRHLHLRSLDWIRSVDPGLDQTGTPEYYAPIGIQAVALQPSNASEIFVDSTAAGDTGTAYLEGIRTGGYFRALNVTMTGVTAVSFAAAITDFVEITKFYISAAAVGTVTLLEDVEGGTELARIPIGQTFSRYQGLQLWPTPSAAVTYFVDYTRNIPDLSVTNDEPLLPEDFHWLLVEGSLIKEWTKKDDLMRREAAQADYNRGLSDLKYAVMCPAEFLPARSQAAIAANRLGANYPAQNW